MITSEGMDESTSGPEAFNGHLGGCMCDRCIVARNRKRIAKSEADAAERNRRANEAPYIARRGGDPGSISVHEALKAKRRR